MEELVRTMKITYRWWRGGKKHIKEAHIEALQESAEDRIRTMMKEGCRSGELNDNIRMTEKDPEDGVEYTGHWEITYGGDE